MTTSVKSISLSAVSFLPVTAGGVCTSTTATGVVASPGYRSSGSVALAGGDLSTGSSYGPRSAVVTDTSVHSRAYRAAAVIASGSLHGGALPGTGMVGLAGAAAHSGAASRSSGKLTATGGTVPDFAAYVRRQGVAVAGSRLARAVVSMVGLGSNRSGLRVTVVGAI